MKTTDLILEIVIMACALTYVTSAIIRSQRDRNQLAAGGDYDRSYFIQYECERRELVISCPDQGKISIVRAMYGRQFPHYCPTPDIDDDLQSLEGQAFPLCAAPMGRTTSYVSRRCNGKGICYIPVVNHLFGDPCPNTYKYLEVYFACSNDRKRS